MYLPMLLQRLGFPAAFAGAAGRKSEASASIRLGVPGFASHPQPFLLVPPLPSELVRPRLDGVCLPRLFSLAPFQPGELVPPQR